MVLIELCQDVDKSVSLLGRSVRSQTDFGHRRRPIVVPGCGGGFMNVQQPLGPFPRTPRILDRELEPLLLDQTLTGTVKQSLRRAEDNVDRAFDDNAALRGNGRCEPCLR